MTTAEGEVAAPEGVATGPHRVTVAGTGIGFDVAPGERLLAAARRAGVWLPFECGWGGCGTCKVTVLEGETTLLHPAPSVDPRDARRRRVVTCQSTPTTDLSIRPGSVSGAPPTERAVRDHRGVLVAREDLGPDLARFRFDLGSTVHFRPGQHAVLDLGDGMRRCYSLACRPGSTEVSFVAKHYAGRLGSGRLFALGTGAEIGLELPYGDMFVRPGERPVVLVAGGTGVSAVLAMALQLAADRDPREVHVFYGAGARSDLVCWDELAEAVAALPRGALHGVLATGHPGWSGGEGFVTDALAAHLPALAEGAFHVAGPPPMTDATVSLLRDHGVQLDRVHHDSFG